MRSGLVLAVAVLLLPGYAHAKGAVERAFRGRVVITEKRPPEKFRSDGAFIRFLRANRKEHLWPDKKNKKQWKFEFMAFFKRPLDDLECQIKFFDITEGKKFIAGDTFYTASKGQSILASNMVLESARFSVNRKYLMQVLTPRNVLLSNTTFWLRGQKEVYSGRVTFSDEETRVKDD